MFPACAAAEGAARKLFVWLHVAECGSSADVSYLFLWFSVEGTARKPSYAALNPSVLCMCG